MYLQRADLFRYDDDRLARKIIPFNLENILLNKDDSENYLLKPGDEILIYSKDVFNLNYDISVLGAVNAPGNIEFKPGMNLKDAILASNGVTKNVFRYKVEIARVDPEILDENIYAETFSVFMNNDYSIIKLNKELGSDSTQIKLMPYDKIFVRPDPFFSMQKMVTITGAVYFPGEYAILRSDETIYDIIQRAGGLRLNAFKIGSSFSRQGKKD